MIVCTISCKHGLNPRFVDYLQAEQAMRDRLNDSFALNDSLAVLREHYRIDYDAELEYLKHHPEQWVVVLNMLRNQK